MLSSNPYQHQPSTPKLLMWVKQCQKPPMSGNGNHTTYKNGDLGVGFMVLFYTHYTPGLK